LSPKWNTASKPWVGNGTFELSYGTSKSRAIITMVKRQRNQAKANIKKYIDERLPEGHGNRIQKGRDKAL